MQFLCTVTYGINQLIYEGTWEADCFAELGHLHGVPGGGGSQQMIKEIFLLMICAIYELISWKADNHENYDDWRSQDFLLCFDLLVRCKREVDSGDVEVDVWQAGDGIVEL